MCVVENERRKSGISCYLHAVLHGISRIRIGDGETELWRIGIGPSGFGNGDIARILLCETCWRIGIGIPAARAAAISAFFTAYPSIGRMSTTAPHAGYGCDDDAEFAFALDLLLEGLAARHASGWTSAP